MAKKITSAAALMPAVKSLNVMELSKEMMQVVIKLAGYRSQSACLLVEMSACVYTLQVRKKSTMFFLSLRVHVGCVWTYSCASCMLLFE